VAEVKAAELEAVRAENARVKAQMEAARIENARIEAALKPAPLRRSQRIMDRDAKRMLESQNTQLAARFPKPIPRRKPRGKASDRNPELLKAKAKVQRVKGSRITKKKAASARGSKSAGRG
jgi:hypothetical protein